MSKENQEQVPNNKKQQQEEKPKKQSKPPLSVNNQTEYSVYLANLQHLAMNGIPVFLNPDLCSVPELTADARSRDHFIQIQYNPDTMSHMIIKVMPEMKTMMELSDGSELDSEMSDEDSINTILDAMLEKQEQEKPE